MRDEPDIVKELREEEKQGKLYYFKTNTVFSEEYKNNKNFNFESENKNYILIKKSLDKISEGIGIANISGKSIYHNSAFIKLTGYTPEDLNLVGGFVGLYDDIGKTQEILKTIQNGNSWSGKIDLIKKNQESVTIFLNADSIKNENGEVIGLIGIHTDITKREKIVRESEEKYRNLIESSPIAVGIIDNNGVFSYWNAAAEKIYGFSKDEIIGKHFTKTKLVKKRDYPKYLKLFTQILRGKKIGPIEINLLNNNGENLIVEVNYNVIKQDGKRVGIQAITQDITDKKKTERKLKESEERYRLIIQSSDAAITFFDKQGNFTLINDIGAKRLGKKPKEIIGKSIYDFWPKEEADKHFKRFQKVMKSGKSADFEDSMEVPAGCFTFFTNIQPTKDADGRIVGVQLMSHDITERKKAEQEIKYLKEYNENILESTPNSIIIVKGNVVEYVNKSFISTFGKNKDSFISKNLKDVVPEEAISVFDDIMQQSDKITELNVKGKIFSVSSFVVKKAEEEEEEERIGIILQDITRLKKVEHLLKQSEEKFRTIFDNSTDGILVADMENKKFVMGNNTICRMLGYSIEEIKDLGVMEIHPKEDLPFVVEQFEKQARREIISAENIPMKRKDGSVFYADINSAPIIMDRKAYLLGSFRDITNRKKAEQELQRSEEKFRLLFNDAPIGIALVDKNGIIREVNNSLLQILSIQKDDFIGKNFVELAPSFGLDFKENIIDFSNRLAEKPPKKEITFLNKNNSKTTISIQSTTIKSGDEIFGILYYLEDITERKLAEKKLTHFQKVVTSATDAIGMSTPDGRHYYQNEAFTKMFGLSVGETDGASGPPATVYADEKVGQKVFDTIKRGNSFIGEVKMLDKDRNEKDILLRAFSVKDEEGKVIGLVGIHTDISERKKSEELLIESDKRYKDLIEGSRDGYIMTDIDDNILEYNTTFKAMTGYTDKDLKDKKLKDLTPIEWHKKTEEMDKHVLKDGYSEVYEKEIVRKDGRIIPVELRKYLIKESGKTKGMWSFVRDISERKQSENEIIEKIKTLEKYKNLTVGRELRIIELKEKVKKLEEKLGEGKK